MDTGETDRVLGRARHHPAFVQLYYALEARRTEEPSIVLQFIAPSAGAGTTTIASGYARVAAAEQSRPVLYIDCSGGPVSPPRSEPPSLHEVYCRDSRIREPVAPASETDNLGWARLCAGLQPLLQVSGEHFRVILEELRSRYSVIILDCPAATSPDAAALARFSDGTVLVAATASTRESEIQRARRLIQYLGGQIAGLVLNRISLALSGPVVPAH
jgi:cellulose biosynthesis protein BcsQ